MAYFRDWFGRSAEHDYTKYDSTKRSINWDHGLDNYSDYFFGSTKSVELEGTASLLKTMSKVLGVKTSDFSVKDSPQSIHIPTDLLKDESLSKDIFLGAALQNIASNVYQTGMERVADASAARVVRLNDFVYKVLNSERINNLMGEDTPGYLKFVQKYKKHKFLSRVAPATDKKDQKLMDLFDRIVRYPENIEESEIEEFKDPIEKIRKIIEKSGGIPSEQEDCVKLSKKITKVISTYLEEEPPEEDTSSGSDGSDSSPEDSSDSESTEEDKPEDKPEDKKKGKKTIDPDFKKYLKDVVESMKEPKTEDTATFEEFKTAIEQEESRASTIVNKVDYIHPSVTSSTRSQYERSSSKVDHTKSSVLAHLLQRKNRDYQFSIKSMRSGRLDTNKLAEAKQNVSTIYERIGEVKTNKLSVTVLVDESGSMGGEKIEAARQAAIFLYESLKGVKDVELFIYGHTADLPNNYGTQCLKSSGHGSTQLLIYTEPGVNNSVALGNISAKYENRDGVAILAAAKRVRSKTQNQGVFIIISDGQPSARDYGGSTAITHVKRMAIEVEKMGFEVVQVTIGGYRSRDMFKNVIDMDDVSKFPEQFVGYLKKKVNSLIKETIRM